MTAPRRRKTLLFGLLTVALLLAFQELVFRIVFPIPEVTNFNRMIYSSQFPQQDQPRFLSNASFRWNSAPDDHFSEHDLNLYGFRDEQWSINPEDGRRRIALVGDSLVEGFLASDEQTIAAGFAATARERSEDVELMNFGIGASQMRDYVLVIRDLVPLFRPDDVVLVVYANDMLYLPPFDPNWLHGALTPQRANPLEPRLWNVLKRLWTDQAIALAWDQPPFDFIASVPDARNPWSSSEWVEQHAPLVESHLRSAMEAGQFNAYATNYYSVQRDYLRQDVEVHSYLDALRVYTAHYGTRLWVVYLPANNQVSDAYLQFQSEYDREKNPTSLTGQAHQLHARLFAEACDVVSLPFLDLTPIMREREAGGERLYWQYDEHLRGSSYLMLGEKIYDWLAAEERGNPDS